jgi:hypothetical protein
MQKLRSFDKDGIRFAPEISSLIRVIQAKCDVVPAAEHVAQNIIYMWISTVVNTETRQLTIFDILRFRVRGH